MWIHLDPLRIWNHVFPGGWTVRLMWLTTVYPLQPSVLADVCLAVLEMRSCVGRDVAPEAAAAIGSFTTHVLYLDQHMLFFAAWIQYQNTVLGGVVRVTHKSIPQLQRIICRGGWELHPGQQELTSLGLSLPVGDSQRLPTSANWCSDFPSELVDMFHGSTISGPVFVWAPLSNSYRYKEGYSSSNVTIALNNYLSNVKHKNSEE